MRRDNAIYELQHRGILTGDASIAVFLTGVLALGLVVLRLYGGGITYTVEGYLFGNLLLVDKQDFDLLVWISVISISFLLINYQTLLATAIDPISIRIQGIPVRLIDLLFSMVTAAVVVSMVQIIGTLLVTALLVTPAATAQLIGKSFRSCVIWTQFFGLTSVILGIYLTAEHEAGSGAGITLVATVLFFSVLLVKSGSARLLVYFGYTPSNSNIQ